MRSSNRAAWKELWLPLVLLACTAVVLPVAIAARNWTIVALLGVGILPLLASIASHAKAILRGQPPKPAFGTTALLRLSSKAQRGLVLIVAVVMMAVGTALVMNSWAALILIPAVALPLLVQLLVVVWREGWSGEKTRDH